MPRIHVDPDNDSYQPAPNINYNHNDVSTLINFSRLLERQYADESQTQIAISILETLAYIKLNFEYLKEAVNNKTNIKFYKFHADINKQVLRAYVPHNLANDMAFHIIAHDSGDVAISEFSRIIETIEHGILCIHNRPENIKKFIYSVDDNDVGCLEQRLSRTNLFLMQLMDSDISPKIDDLFADFIQWKTALGVDSSLSEKQQISLCFRQLLDYFTPKLGVLVYCNDEHVQLTLDIIRQYANSMLAWEYDKVNLRDLLSDSTDIGIENEEVQLYFANVDIAEDYVLRIQLSLSNEAIIEPSIFVLAINQEEQVRFQVKLTIKQFASLQLCHQPNMHILQRSNNDWDLYFANSKDAVLYTYTMANIFDKLPTVYYFDDRLECSYGFRITDTERLGLIRMLYLTSNAMKLDTHLIKNLRGDEMNYALDFIKEVTEYDSTIVKKSKRMGNKKQYTVKGTGVIDRTTRRPQYSPEEKQYFSKFQSTTVITNNIQPKQLYHANTSDNATVACLFDIDKSLPNRYYIYRGIATYGRPYDFDTEAAAETYFIQQTTGENPTLFPTLPELLRALSRPANKDKISEVLARLKWTENSSYLAITSPTDSACYLAQGYAFILKNRLKKRAESLQQPFDVDYQVPIIYYLRDSKLKHLKEYTQLEQAMSRAHAQWIYADAQARLNHFQQKQFEFLLVVEPINVLLSRSSHVYGHNLLSYLILQGYMHIADMLLYKYQSQFPGQLPDSFAIVAYIVVEKLISKNRIDWISLLLQHDKINLTIILNNLTIINYAASHEKWDIVKLIIEKYPDHDGNNAKQYASTLVTAATDNNLDIVKLLLSINVRHDYYSAPRTGNIAIHEAIRHNNKEMLSLLLDRGAEQLALVNRAYQTPLQYAATNNNWDACNLIIEKYPRLLHQETYAFHLLAAIRTNREDVTIRKSTLTYISWQVTQIIEKINTQATESINISLSLDLERVVKEARDEYYLTPTTEQWIASIKKCQDAFTAVKIDLNSNREYDDICCHLALCLCTAGIGNVIAAGYTCYKSNGRQLFFRTSHQYARDISLLEQYIPTRETTGIEVNNIIR